EAVKSIEAGDELEVNFDTGVIKNLTKDEEYQGEAFPEFMQNIINNNGLIGYIKNKNK
ncbi:MAG: 3-isopropylmalate dehydratase small subunit, partial [Clostridium saudiense]|nr:3-isopropylmalate dehydratase small subunit [Clostridium saudiense]